MGDAMGLISTRKRELSPDPYLAARYNVLSSSSTSLLAWSLPGLVQVTLACSFASVPLELACLLSPGSGILPCVPLCCSQLTSLEEKCKAAEVADRAWDEDQDDWGPLFTSHVTNDFVLLSPFLLSVKWETYSLPHLVWIVRGEYAEHLIHRKKYFVLDYLFFLLVSVRESSRKDTKFPHKYLT